MNRCSLHIQLRQVGKPGNKLEFRVVGDGDWMNANAHIVAYAVGLLTRHLGADAKHIADVGNELEDARKLLGEGKEFKGRVVQTIIARTP
jgi:hypothetical protein